MTDQPIPRPAGLDDLLDHVAANLPDETVATAEAAALLAPIAAAVRERQARHDAQVRATALAEATDIAHAEGTRLYDDMGQKTAAGAWAVRDHLRGLAGTPQPALAAPLIELRIPRVLDLATDHVLYEIASERLRQNEKWGPQNHPDGTGGAFFAERAANARAACQAAAAKGEVTWRHILEEEFKEATAEYDSAGLRAELVQVAAVAVAWIEAIDRRTALGTDDTCRIVEIDGEPIRVHGAREMTVEDTAALAEVVAAARRKFAAEHPEAAGVEPPAGGERP